MIKYIFHTKDNKIPFYCKRIASPNYYTKKSYKNVLTLHKERKPWPDIPIIKTIYIYYKIILTIDRFRREFIIES